jgi:hypothetical protein
MIAAMTHLPGEMFKRWGIALCYGPYMDLLMPQAWYACIIATIRAV